MTESLDLIPLTKITAKGPKGNASSKQQLVNSKLNLSILSRNKDADATEEDAMLKEDSSPMPSSVPNFLVKTYEIVNVSLFSSFVTAGYKNSSLYVF